MNSQHRAIRAFALPEVEETMLIECDVRRRTYAQLCGEGYSPEVVKKARRRAYAKIADELANGG